MAHSIDVLTTSCAEASSKNVPLQVDLAKFPLLSKDEGSKLRRPVRPIDRQRMRPWLMELLDLGNVFGLRWTDRRLGKFQISWRHASRLGWNLETDGDVFERWAKHTGIYKEGDPPEPKRWKANFRCALHSLHDVVDLTIAVERRGRNACRTYQFLQSNDDKSASKKTKARRAKDLSEYPQQKYLQEDVPAEMLDSCTDEEIASHGEFEAFRQDKVIVQKLDMKPEILVEDFCLHHDHDYAGPDKTHKTIFLRHGVGSIVLQKEIQSAPGAADEVENLMISNLDQLASAAMNSVGIESMQAQEFSEKLAYRKASISERSVVEMHEFSLSDDANIKQCGFNVKYLSEQTSVLGDGAICSNNFTRKRKSLAIEDESFVVQSDSEAGDLDKDECSLGIFTNGGLASSPCTRQRTSSPKILCRKSKRSKACAEKSVTGSSEPLMSSCLLLLEAATRLDNAEKTGESSLSSKLQTGRQNLNTCPGFQHYEFSSVESQGQNDSTTKLKTSTHEFPKSVELQRGTSQSNHTEISRNVKSFGILRTTLENTDKMAEYKGNVHTFKAKHPIESGNSAGNSSEVKIIVKEEPFATGLFSGSKIEPKSPIAFILNKHDSNKEAVVLPIQKHTKTEGDCKPASVSGKRISQPLSTITRNRSAVKSGTVIQKMVIKGVFPGFDAAQKTSDIADVTFDDQCTQIYVCAGDASQTIAETNTEKTKIKDFSNSYLSSSVLPRVREHALLSSNNDNFSKSVSGKTPLISVLNTPDICSSSGTKTYTVTSLSSSFGSVIVSPTPVLRNVKFTATSCHTTPMEVLPNYSQADITISSKSSDLHLSECQNLIPLKADGVISSSYIVSNCPSDSTESSLLLVQDKDLFIIQPGKNLESDIAFKVVSASTSSPVAPIKLPAEVKNAVSAEELESMKSQGLSNFDIHEVPDHTWQNHSHRQSALVRSREAQVDCSVSVIKNETAVTVNDVDLSRGLLHSEELDSKKSLIRADVLYEMVSTSCPQTPLHKPTVSSCSFKTEVGEIGNLNQSGIILHDSSENMLHCSSNKSSHLHQSASSSYQTSETDGKEDKPLQVEHSLCLSHTANIINVQSLAQLCRKYLAHLFTTLDNQASESDENDSVTESPQCELKEGRQEINDLAQAVILQQQKLSSLKSGSMWQDVSSGFRRAENNVIIDIKVPGKSIDIAVSPKREFQSQSTTVDIASTGIMCSSEADYLASDIQEHTLDSTSTSQTDDVPGCGQPSMMSHISVSTSSAPTDDYSLGASYVVMSDVSNASSVVTPSPFSADVANISAVTLPPITSSPVTTNVSNISSCTTPPITNDISNISALTTSSNQVNVSDLSVETSYVTMFDISNSSSVVTSSVSFSNVSNISSSISPHFQL